MNFKGLWELLKETYNEWSEDKTFRLGAALAFYTMFSLAPLLIIVIAMVGLVFGREAVQGQLVTEMQNVVGRESAKTIEAMIERAYQPTSSIFATIAGIVTLLYGATHVFAELQDALNTIWEVASKPGRGIIGMIKDRFVSFVMVLGIGFLLLVSLFVSAALTAIGTFFTNLLPIPAYVLQILNFFISFGVITLLFAMIYKVLPDVQIVWSDVWIGAVVTALLFVIGKFLIGWYLGNSSVGSVYGTAGSFVIVLI